MKNDIEWDIVPREICMRKISDLEKTVNKLSDLLYQSMQQQNDYRMENENLKSKLIEMQKEHQKYINKILQNNELIIKNEFMHYKNKLKPILKDIQTTNKEIKHNLQSGLYKERSDNLIWRSYSNSFLGLNSLVNPLIVSAKLIDDKETDKTTS